MAYQRARTSVRNAYYICNEIKGMAKLKTLLKWS